MPSFQGVFRINIIPISHALQKKTYKMVNSWDCLSQGNLRSDPVSSTCHHLVYDCGKMYKKSPPASAFLKYRPVTI